MADLDLEDDDYGLEEVGGSGGDDDDEEDDLANDDTFGDVPTTREGLGGDFDFNNEGMARLHEEFLAAGGDGGGGGGFFGDALDGGQEFTLEAGLDAGMQDAGMVQGLDMDLGFLDDPAPAQAAPPSPLDKRNGLRVAGLPPNLDEVQVKQVLSHFGPLASFSLTRGAGANVALLSYQDPAVAKEAATSLNGVPLGGNATLDVQLIDLAAGLFAAAAAAAAPPQQQQQQPGGAMGVSALEARYSQLQPPSQPPAPAPTPPQPLPPPPMPPQPTPGQPAQQQAQAQAQPGQPQAQAQPSPEQLQQLLLGQLQQLSAVPQQIAHLPREQQQQIMQQVPPPPPAPAARPPPPFPY